MRLEAFRIGSARFRLHTIGQIVEVFGVVQGKSIALMVYMYT